MSPNHVIPPLEELKNHAYCKWHNSYSHATNDCNVFHWQVQSAINEGRLKFTESSKMKLDSDPFLVNMVNFERKKVLVWPSQAESTKGKDVIIGEDNVKPKMIKPKDLEVGHWKVNERKSKATKKLKKPETYIQCTFAQYESGKTDQKGGNRPNTLKHSRSPPKHEFKGRKR